MIRPPRETLVSLLIAFASALYAICPATAAANADPPKVQAAMDRGLAAAKQRDWGLAIKYFAEVHKAAPDNPTAMYNLALAYNNSKGRELVAICWFNAYLAAAPNAPNAALVRKRIIALEVAVEANIRKLAAIASKPAFAG